MDTKSVALIFLALAAFTLSGCATFRGPPPYFAQVQGHDVDAVILAKVEAKKGLNLEEIKHLAERGVDEETIIAHLRKTRAVYTLSVEEIDELKEAGADQGLINFMLKTPEIYGTSRTYGYGYPYTFGIYSGRYYRPHYYGYYPSHHHYGYRYGHHYGH